MAAPEGAWEAYIYISAYPLENSPLSRSRRVDRFRSFSHSKPLQRPRQLDNTRITHARLPLIIVNRHHYIQRLAGSDVGSPAGGLAEFRRR